MSWWQGLIGLRGAAGETTTRESSQVGVETKILIQVMAFFVIVVIAVPFTWFGSWIALTGFLALMDVELMGADVLFIAVFLALAAWTLRANLPKLEAASDRVRFLVWGLLMALGTAFLAVVYARLDRGLEFWPALGLAFGTGFLYGGPLLAFNMTVLLRDPYAWQSPFERRYLDLYERERFPEAQEPQRVIHEIRTPKGEFVTSTESLGLEWEQLVRFARDLVDNRYDLREEAWSKGDLFESYGAYRRFRNTLEAQGLIRKINPKDSKSTYEPTRGGRAAFEMLAEQ